MTGLNSLALLLDTTSHIIGNQEVRKWRHGSSRKLLCQGSPGYRVIPPELEIHTHSTCPQVILIYTNFCDTCDGTQERSLLLVYKAFEKQLRFPDFAIPPQILPWLKMEVPTGAGYKWPTQGISVLNHFQNPNKFSRMEICPYPCFGSPGGDTCFAHYDSFSPSLSTEAKRRSVLRSCRAGSAHSTASDQKITPVLSPVRTFE